MELLNKTLTRIIDETYSGISDEGRKAIESILIRKEYKKGELLISEGETSRYFVFVASGMIRQFYFKHGKDVTEHFAREGSVMMCIESLLKQEPTHLMAEALEPSVAYLLPYDKFHEMIYNSREIGMFYMKLLESALIKSQQKADSWRFETARERYNRLLKSNPEVIKRAPLSYIASYLLMTPETLSRVRSGIIK